MAELSGLKFLPAKVETPVGTTLTLNLAAFIEMEPGNKVQIFPYLITIVFS